MVTRRFSGCCTFSPLHPAPVCQRHHRRQADLPGATHHGTVPLPATPPPEAVIYRLARRERCGSHRPHRDTPAPLPPSGGPAPQPAEPPHTWARRGEERRRRKPRPSGTQSPSPPPQHGHCFEDIVPLQDGAVPLTNARAAAPAQAVRHRRRPRRRRGQRAGAPGGRAGAGGACALRRHRHRWASRRGETAPERKEPTNEGGQARPPRHGNASRSLGIGCTAGRAVWAPKYRAGRVRASLSLPGAGGSAARRGAAGAAAGARALVSGCGCCGRLAGPPLSPHPLIAGAAAVRRGGRAPA